MMRWRMLCGWAMAAVSLWLIADIWIHDGRMLRRVVSLRPDIVAWVGRTAITRSQVERELRESLWLEGRDRGAIGTGELDRLRRAALERCIDDELLLADAERAGVVVDRAEVDERLRRFAIRFESPEAMREAMRREGMNGECELMDRLTLRLRIEKHAESLLAPLVAVSEDEARAWFDQHRESFAIPERVEAKHLFIATLATPSDAARTKLESAKRELDSGAADFAALAARWSEDVATKDRGGALGWMTRHRLPADFADAVFALPVGVPTLVRTKIGWHLVEVTARLPREDRTFEQARDEVVAAMDAIRRNRAVDAIRERLRRDAAADVIVFESRIGGSSPPAD